MKALIPLTILGLFSVLAAFSHGKYGPTEPPASYTIAQVEAVNRLAADAGVMVKIQPQHDCGLDWLCLVVEAEKQHPRKGKKK